MRDQAQRHGGYIGEIAFEPVAGGEVEVVGGLVEKEQVGLCEEQLGERNAHLPATGEFFDAALPVGTRKAEAGEDRADGRDLTL